MSVALLSISGLGYTSTLAGAVSASRNAWSTLGEKLSDGDLSSARTAFGVYKRLIADSTNAATNTQFATDLADLGTALTTGSLAKAQSAYEAVSQDTKSDPVLAINNAAASAKQTGQILSALIDPGSSGSSSSSDPYAAILDTAYSQLSSSLTSGESSYLSGSDSSSSSDSSSYLQLVYGKDASSDAAKSVVSLYA